MRILDVNNDNFETLLHGVFTKALDTQRWTWTHQENVLQRSPFEKVTVLHWVPVLRVECRSFVPSACVLCLGPLWFWSGSCSVSIARQFQMFLLLGVTLKHPKRLPPRVTAP